MLYEVITLDRAHGDKERKLAELDEDNGEAEKELKTLQPLKILSENEYHEYALKFGHIFEAKIGAEALDELLKNRITSYNVCYTKLLRALVAERLL